MKLIRVVAHAALVAAFSLTVGAQEHWTVLPKSLEPFKGMVDLRAKDSKPDFPQPIKAPDDLGFGATATFGGPYNSPTFQKLADNVLRYNKFRTTGLCRPARAALLTGRNHYSAHSGVIIEGATGFDGYNSIIGKETGTVVEILRQNGYGTA